MGDCLSANEDCNPHQTTTDDDDDYYDGDSNGRDILCYYYCYVLLYTLTMIRKESTEQMSRGRKDKSPQLCSTISVVEANYYYYHNNHHPAPPRHHPRQKQHRNSPLFRQNFKISANPICTLLFANSLICVSHSPPASPMSETRRRRGS